MPHRPPCRVQSRGSVRERVIEAVIGAVIDTVTECMEGAVADTMIGSVIEACDRGL